MKGLRWISLSLSRFSNQSFTSQVTIQEPELKKANSAYPLPCGHVLLNDSNNVEWHVKVESGVELQLKLLYTVEHPAQDAVEGLPK